MATKGLVLLVDDDAHVLRSESERLKRLGFDSVTADRPEAAWQALAANDADVVITDIHMPGNEGLGFQRELAQTHPGLPVIIITGEPALETACEALSLGVRAYLVKPFSTAQLSAELDAAMAIRRLSRSLLGARHLLDECQAKVSKAEALLAGKTSTAQAETAFLDVMLWHVVSATADLCRFVADASAAREDEPHAALASAVSLSDLVGALHETVATLDRTKSLFKSKDLGALRRNIEDLLTKLGHNA